MTVQILITWDDGSTTRGTSGSDPGIPAEVVADETTRLLLLDSVWLTLGSVYEPKDRALRPGPVHLITTPDRIRSIQMWDNNSSKEITPHD